MKRLALLLAFVTAPAAAFSEGVAEGLLADYRAAGAGPFSANGGAEAWQRQVAAGNGEAPRSCASCHGTDPRSAGRHAKTGKVIDPLAPAANPARLTDAATIEKWFRRNCEWTWGRVCTPQEKGDFLSYLNSYRP